MKIRSNYQFLRVIFLVVLVLGAVDGIAEEENITKVIAKVNNEVITSKDLDDFCNFLKYRNPDMQLTDKVRKDALEKLIEDKLILSEAKKEKMKVSEGWLKENLEKFISSYPSPEAFEESLIKNGLNITMIKEKLREQYLTQAVIEKYVRSKIMVSPMEITDFYNRHKQEFVYPKMYVLWIGKDTEETKLNQIANRIEEKKNNFPHAFSNILNRVKVAEESLRPEIKNIVANLDEGQLKIEKISDSYYLIYLEKIIPSKNMPLSEAKEKIYSYLWQEKFNKAFQDWIKKLKEKAVIKIYE